MEKKHLNLKGAILIVVAWVIGAAAILSKEAGAAPILFWVGLAGYCVLTCFSAAAFMEAHWQKQKKKIHSWDDRWE